MRGIRSGRLPPPNTRNYVFNYRSVDGLFIHFGGLDSKTAAKFEIWKSNGDKPFGGEDDGKSSIGDGAGLDEDEGCGQVILNCRRLTR